MVDTLALGASAARREGSSPFIPTIVALLEPEVVKALASEASECLSEQVR